MATLPPFRNERWLDWTDDATRERFERALKKVRKRFPIRVEPRIDGRDQDTISRFVSTNPNRISEVAADVGLCGIAEAARAAWAAQAQFSAWRDRPAAKRADCLLRAAKIARARRYDLAALQVLEVGKAWAEADADICEGIDFLEYYAREALRLAEPRKMGDAPGEDSRLTYEPRGVTLVIAPWNFPMAISFGMVSAALAAGNTVVYKPSSDSAACAAEVVGVFEEAGIPPGVLNFVTGSGQEIGPALVEHPAVVTIAFTGSKDVGLEINRRAAASSEDSLMIKRVIAELGGKNAIVVDADADFDQAVAAVVASAFGYQGQKCSACARLILLDKIHDRFLGRLVEAVNGLPLGPVEEQGNIVGAVINQAAIAKVERYVELGKRELALAIERRFDGDGGYFPPVAVFRDVPPDHPLAQDEIFGPVLAVIRVEDFDHALEVASGTAYALTGSVFSRNPKHIANARRHFRVGNLYINRGCTGALVERHPFGGFKMSGVGSKAGGPDYLQQFMVPRTIVEKTA